MLSRKTYQKQGICYVTKTFVTCNKFPYVQVAHSTEKVGQAWSMLRLDHELLESINLDDAWDSAGPTFENLFAD